MSRFVRVIKVGGSLFDFKELPSQLRTWIDAQTPATNVLIAGGGSAANVIRDVDGRYEIGKAMSHWLSVAMMDINSRIIARLLKTQYLTDFASLDIIEECPTVVFGVEDFLHQVEPDYPGEKLPLGWNVTSDSIAARLATILKADELVLLKSADTTCASAECAANSDFVDEYFPTATKWLSSVRCVNLRCSQFSETRFS